MRIVINTDTMWSKGLSKGTKCKVYGEMKKHFPSGMRNCYKVYDAVEGRTVWIKADLCDMVKE